MGEKHYLTILFLLIVLVMTLFNFEVARASENVIYLKNNGEIIPRSAPIHTSDNITYTFTDDVYNSTIVIERDNIVIDGAWHVIWGPGDVGLDLSYRKNVTIVNLKVVGFSVAIKLFFSKNIYVKSVFLTKNRYGIYAINSVLCDIRGSSLNNNDFACKFSTSHQPPFCNFTIIGNSFVNNSLALWLWNSSGNSIHHNNFLNNTIQVSLTNSIYNEWNDDSEGNYWSDYLGSDMDGDGIGDDPYVIDENNRDLYPLMGKYYEFDFQMKNKLFKIAIISNSTIVNDKNMLGFQLKNCGNSTFCRLRIPNQLLNAPYSIICGPPYSCQNPLSYKTVKANDTYTWIYFVYPYQEDGSIVITTGFKPPPLWFQWWFWGIFVLSVITCVFIGEYFLQRKTIFEYRQKLKSFQQVSHLDVAKLLFEADLRRTQKILEKFSKRHNVRIRQREEGFEEVLKRLGIQKKERK